MQEQIFLYSIVFYFFIACYSGYKHGASYEILSLLSFISAIILSLLVYSDELLNKTLSLIVFVSIYFLGQFASFIIKKRSKTEKFLGIFVGGIKYLLHILFLNALTILSKTHLLSYNENILTQYTQPTAIYIANKIEKYIWK